ncbi:NADH-quinone oxidoreductase subunit NuoK [Buchnera aphidicola (Ceratovacuna keduensis)]|uniref:NADH-quinone oxidoreductase subunit NuoK n=1 Tax=Buchnera aphidicola TaxID=9 RepID=UPI0031B84B3C
MIPIFYCFILSVLIFSLGTLIFFIKNNLFLMMIGLEIMINACLLLFIISGNYWNNESGQIIYIFIITSSAAEVCVSLSLLLKFYKINNTLNVNLLSELKK